MQQKIKVETKYVSQYWNQMFFWLGNPMPDYTGTPIDYEYKRNNVPEGCAY